MHGSRAGLGLAVHGATIYAAGGKIFNSARSPNLSPTSRIERYDVVKDCWEKVAPMIDPHFTCCAVFLENRMYVFCGANRYDTSLHIIQVYDPNDNSWLVGKPMSMCRYADAVVVLDGYIYVMGGWTAGDRVSCVERFAPETGQWEEMPKMGKERTFYGATAMNGKIYVCGGYAKVFLSYSSF
ncbi:hypothetical protein Aduo_009327 [Ancylostoma duodenale]